MEGHGFLFEISESNRLDRVEPWCGGWARFERDLLSFLGNAVIHISRTQED